MLRGSLQPDGKLSALLFSVFINDLPDWLKLCIAILYADDIALCYTAKSKDDLLNRLQEDTERIVA